MPEPILPVPTVSVALATCDGERWISRQLESILEQLGPHDEVVLVDASSRDRTLSLVASFADPRIRILRDFPRGDIPGTFQRALGECRGEYVFLSDQDDVWLPGKVERCLATLGGSEAELLLHDARLVEADGRQISPSFLERNGYRPGFLSNLRKSGFLGCAICFKRSLLERALPFPSRLPMHDWWLGLLAEQGRGVVVLREPLILHRLHGANANFAPGSSPYSLARKIWMRILILSFVLGRTRRTPREGWR